MSKKTKNPKWWQLYIMLPVLTGSFVLEIKLGLTGVVNTIAQLAILFLVYTFMQLWIRANRRALMGLDEEQGTWQFKVYEVSPADLAHAREAAKRVGRLPRFDLPEGEVRGVLSTTFEIDDSRSSAGIPVDSAALYSHAPRSNQRRRSRRESDNATTLSGFVRKE